MFSTIWPIALVVVSNMFYQICTKSVPHEMNPFASLTVTYLVGTVLSFVLYHLFESSPNLLKEVAKLNWAPVVLGVAIVFLEVGYICAFKAGWQVSTAEIVQSAILTIALLIVGYLFFHEALTWNKIVGVVICIIGLAVINLK